MLYAAALVLVVILALVACARLFPRLDKTPKRTPKQLSTVDARDPAGAPREEGATATEGDRQ